MRRLILATSSGLAVAVPLLVFAGSPAVHAGLSVSAVEKTDEKRIALVIGNGGYQDAQVPRLRNSLNDARLMADVLRDLGFEVEMSLDADRKSMRRAIREFGRRMEAAEANGVGLFYYSGIGTQVDGRSYLIPVDATIGPQSGFDKEMLNLDVLLQVLKSGPARPAFVILDTSYMARIVPPAGTLVITAAAPGMVSLDGRGDNSPFTRELATAMGSPGLSAVRIFDRVRTLVREDSKDIQVPWIASALTEDFAFHRSQASTTPPSPGLHPPVAAVRKRKSESKKNASPEAKPA